MDCAEDIELIVQVPAHADALFEALSDPAIYEYLDETPPRDVAELRNRIVYLQRGRSKDGNDRWLNWTVLHGPKVVGYTQATVFPDKSASIAYALSPSVWGRGIGFQACRKTISVLIDDHDVSRIHADTEHGNLRSQRLLKRLGFKRTRRSGNDIFFERSLVQSRS